MTTVNVSSDELTALSTKIDTWITQDLGPGVAAVPIDWSGGGIAIASTVGVVGTGLVVGGAAVLGGPSAAINKSSKTYDAIMNAETNRLGFRITGRQGYDVANGLLAAYEMYDDLVNGEYLGAALAAVKVVASAVDINQIRQYMNDPEVLNTGKEIYNPLLLDLASYACMGFQYLCGLSGDFGEVFASGADDFTHAASAVQDLLPNDWTGNAADSYGKQISNLLNLLTQMAQVDTGMVGIMETQMHALDYARTGIEAAAATVAIARPIARNLHFAGLYEKSLRCQKIAAASAIAACIGSVTTFLILNDQRAHEVDALTTRYADLEEKANAALSKIGGSETTADPLKDLENDERYPHYVTLWFSHGPVSGGTNLAAEDAENARAAAGKAIAQLAAELSSRLTTASGTYAATDDQQAETLDAQMQV